MESILKRLFENKRLRENAEVTIKINDPEGNIMELLKTVSDYSRMGHSFRVVVDPGDKEREKQFWIDGDGSDKLYLD